MTFARIFHVHTHNEIGENSGDNAFFSFEEALKYRDLLTAVNKKSFISIINLYEKCEEAPKPKKKWPPAMNEPEIILTRADFLKE